MTMTEYDAPIEHQVQPPAAQQAFEPCDQCQAPLAPEQRYCVVCGTRRPNVDDPVARYLAAAKRARTAPPVPPASSKTAGNGRLALAIALVPLAAALGVLVGRGDAGDSTQLVDALKVQKAPVVNVVGGAGAAGSTATSGGTAGADATKTTSASKAKGGAIIARTPYGTARKLEGSKPTASQIVESKKALKKITDAKGKAYVESQRGLPDTIVIP